MIFAVLYKLLLKLKAKGTFVGAFLFELLGVLLQHVHVLLEHLLVVDVLLQLFLVLALEALKLFFVSLRDLSNEHSIVRFATVLE